MTLPKTESKKLQIEKHKEISDLVRKAKLAAKPASCILCGNSNIGFCNSHSVPRMVLKNIATNGIVLQANTIIGIDGVDIEKGINKTGTFHFICNDCDSKFFQDYENQDNLLKEPTDLMLSEIALKDSLVALSKHRLSQEIMNVMISESIIQDSPYIHKRDKYLIKQYTDEVEFYKYEIKKNRNNNYQIIYRNILPYKTPIAVESAISLPFDLNGYVVNNLNKPSKDNRIEYMHLCVFPLKNETLILVFNHKRDKKYRSFCQQINSLDKYKVLEFFNWLVIKCIEDYYISDSIKEIIENDIRLRELGQESCGYPNLGIVDLSSPQPEYNPVGIKEIPNFLDSKYAI